MKKKLSAKREDLRNKSTSKTHRLGSKDASLDVLQIVLNNIIADMPGHVYWKDKDGVYLGCNNRQAESLGFHYGKEVIGKTDFELPWKAEIAALFRKNDLRIMRTGNTELVEEKAQVNGKEAIVLSQKTPLRNDKGEIIGILGISIDITDRKIMEKELTLSKEKAEAANYIMTEFISNMGHILVTPISTITGVATMLLYGFSDKYLELKPLFEELMQGCGDWEKAYRQIINATSLAELEVKLESFSVNQELRTIESIMAPSVGSKQLKLIIRPLEPQNQDWIESDKLKFHLILIELISNAIKFTEKGKIRVSASEQDGWLTIEVADTGIGIPADKLDYIFGQYTMLSRAQKYGANFKGVGAGLFLAKQRSKLLDAKITVTSKIGKGSIFTLQIPLNQKK